MHGYYIEISRRQAIWHQSTTCVARR
ncbi:hypothetical protein ACNKHM_19305 [Shigella sonnei]